MPHLYGAASENILDGATVTGTTPSTSYYLSTIVTMDPADRIRFDTGNARFDFTLAEAKTGGVLVLPVSNADAGSSVVTLMNGAGLSIPVPIPAHTRNGIPRTTLLDFSTSGNLSSAAWTLLFSGNSVPVTVGGAVGIFPRNVLPGGMKFEDFGGVKERAGLDEYNEYKNRRRFPLRTLERKLDFSLDVPGSSLSVLEDWFDGTDIDQAGYVWPQLEGVDGYFGTLPTAFATKRLGDTGYFSVQITFAELSKGKPVF